MGQLLNNLATDYIENKFPEYAEEQKHALALLLADRIYNEVLEERSAELMDEAEKSQKVLAAKEHTKGLISLVYEGGLLAFFVGLVANQVTNIISRIQSTSSDILISHPVIWAVALTLACYSILKYRVIYEAVRKGNCMNVCKNLE